MDASVYYAAVHSAASPTVRLGRRLAIELHLYLRDLFSLCFIEFRELAGGSMFRQWEYVSRKREEIFA
jgi:hypothetical protein